MKKYNIVNNQKGGIKAVESSTGHWMLASEVERMLEDMEPSADGLFAHIDKLTNNHQCKVTILSCQRIGNDNGN